MAILQAGTNIMFLPYCWDATCLKLNSFNIFFPLLAEQKAESCNWMSVQSWSLWVCLKEAFVWRPLCSWKSQKEFGRSFGVRRWHIPVQWNVYWFPVLSLAAAFAFDIFSCFEAFTKNNYSFHEMNLLYPPNWAMIHTSLATLPIVIRAAFAFARLRLLLLEGSSNIFLGHNFIAWFADVQSDCSTIPVKTL